MPFRVLDERADGSATVFSVIVPDDCPYFEGHFPGRPILPAIGQLALVAGLIRRICGDAVTLAGVDRLKFSRRITPGDRVEVRLEGVRADHDASFEIRSAGEWVSRGRARLRARPFE